MRIGGWENIFVKGWMGWRRILGVVGGINSLRGDRCVLWNGLRWWGLLFVGGK